MPFDPSRIRAICFDVDGTLSDTDDLMVSRIANRLVPIRRLLPARDPRRTARRFVMAIESPGNAVLTLTDWLRLNRGLDWLYDSLYRGRLGRRPETFWIIQGVQNTVSRLASRYPLAIVSANHAAHTDEFLRQYNLSRYFTTVVTAHTCEHTKPFPDPLVYAARQLGVTTDACLMVGDTSVDIRAGRAVGAQTIGVLCGFGREAELHRAGADLILPVTTYLADVLLSSQAKEVI
jgi:phosphoglycolate phosphatase-like HAD superfamily hydrolase